MLQLHSGKSSYKEKSSVPGPSLMPGYMLLPRAQPRPLSLSWLGSTGSLVGQSLFGNLWGQRETGK